MFASLETWVDRIRVAYDKLTSDPQQIDDRLPSEYVIADYALRGYRGPPTLVSTRKHLGAKRIDGFIDRHAHEMKRTNFRLASADFVERDILALEQLAESCDAVRVVPAR